MLEKSTRWFAGFGLFFVGEVAILFSWLLAAGSSHSTLTLQLGGLLIGTIIGGLVLVSGVALLWGRVDYASAALVLAGVEYGALGFPESGLTPLFYAVGSLLFALGALLAYYARCRDIDDSDVNGADTLITIGVVTLVLGSVATMLIFRGSNPLVGLLIISVGGLVAGAGRMLVRRQSTHESA